MKLIVKTCQHWIFKTMLELINMKLIAKLLDAWEVKAVKYKALSIAGLRYTESLWLALLKFYPY